MRKGAAATPLASAGAAGAQTPQAPEGHEEEPGASDAGLDIALEQSAPAGQLALPDDASCAAGAAEADIDAQGLRNALRMLKEIAAGDADADVAAAEFCSEFDKVDLAELDLDELGRDCCDGLHAGGQGAGSLCKRCKRRAQQSLPDRLCDLASGFECLHAGLFVKLCGDFDPLDCKSLDGYTYDQVLERKYSRYGCKAPPAERPCVADQGVGGVVRPLVLREAWCYDSPCDEPPMKKQRQCK